jgi:hypothetical protein
MSKWIRIQVEDAKKICDSKGLKPAYVANTDILQFTRADSSKNLKIISWEEFEMKIKEKKLGIFEYKGFMKIMKSEE